MNDVLLVLLSIFFITGIGYAIIWGFSLLDEKNNLSTISYAFGLGVGFIAMQLYWYARFNISWNILLLFSPWMFVMLIILIKNRQKLNLYFPTIERLRKIDYILLILIGLTGCYVFFEALLRPVSVWDGLAIWMYKSKMFFIDGTIRADHLNFIDPGYPLIISLLGTFVYLVLGHVNDTAVLLTSFAFYAFLSLLFFSVLKKKYGITYALIFTFLMITTQNFIRHGGRMQAGQADLPLGYYSFVSVLLLFEYIKKNKTKILLLLSIFLGITGLIKVEGIPFTAVIVFFAIYHAYQRKLFHHIVILLIWILPLADWEVYKRVNYIATSYFSAHPIQFTIHKSVNAMYGTIRELINIKSWNMLWIVYFYSLLVVNTKKNKELFIINIVILSQIVVYIFIYLLTSENSPQSSIERLLTHIAPLAFYYLALITYPLRNQLLTKYKKNTKVKKWYQFLIS